MVKKIIIYIVNFFLCLCILLLSSLLIFSNTILNKQYVINVLERNSYYERTYYNIQEGFKNYIMQSGLEESILEDLYDREKVNNDINMVIDAIFENKDINIDTNEIVQKLDDRINDILAGNNRVPETQEREEIKIFEDTIAEVYSDEISYSMDSIKQISNMFEKIQLLLSTIKIALIIITIGMFLLIIAIGRSLKEIINTLGITLTTVGVIEIAIKILIGDRTHNILMLNSTFSASLIDLINSIINTFFYTGIIMGVVGLILIIVSSFIKREEF